MRIIEIGTGYTSIPADKGAATEIVVENLAHALIAQGHDVIVVDIADAGRLPTDLPIVEVPMPRGLSGTDEALGVRHKLKRVVYSIRLAKVLTRLLRREQGQAVLHFHNQYNAFFFLALAPRRLRRSEAVVYTNHSYVWHDPWQKIRETVRRRYFQEVYVMRHADLSFVLNQQAYDTVTRDVGVPERQAKLIKNGVDTDTYRPLPKGAAPLESLRGELGLAGMRPIIQVGSVCDRKNQLGALELLAPHMVEREDLCFLYAGGVIDGEYQRTIEATARDLGLADRVIYLGEIEPGAKLNLCYNLAEAMLFPARAEGFSLVVLEAMSAGLPVMLPSTLSLDLGGCPVFEGQRDFDRVLRSEVLDEERRLANSRLARSAATTTYSWDRVARDYATSFEGLLGAGGGLGG